MADLVLVRLNKLVNVNSAIEQFYRRYIRCINERHADLREFVHDTVVYNEKELTRLEYQNLIAESVIAAPDIYFDVTILVADETHIAARINFHCTPLETFLGCKPTGKSVAFAEHVFYQLRDGKICQVWSLIDVPAVQHQLNDER